MGEQQREIDGANPAVALERDVAHAVVINKVGTRKTVETVKAESISFLCRARLPERMAT